jgi:hypothetical protein
MKFYYTGAEGDAPYTITLAEAKKIARDAAEVSYHDIEVTLVDVSTDRDNVLRLLNNSGGIQVPRGTVYTAKAKLKKRDDT